jgi:hypothetical protein
MVSEQVMEAFRMEQEQSMLKEMQQILVVMLAHLDQYLGNPTHLDQTVGDQSCDPTKSPHNQGEMERSNKQTKCGLTNSRCVINPKVAKLDISSFNGNGGSHNTRKDCRSQKNKKVQASISMCCAPMKIEDYRKGEPTKSKRLIIKKQKRSSLWRKKKKKKKNPLRTMDDFRGRECYGST